jgi:hypothetical protein
MTIRIIFKTIANAYRRQVVYIIKFFLIWEI